MEIIQLVKNDLDKLVAVISLILFTGITFILIYVNYNFTYIISSLSIVFICILWFFLNKNISFNIKNIYNKKFAVAANIAFLIVFMFSITFFYNRQDIYQRPSLFFIAIAILVIIIFAEIMFTQINRTIILLQIIILGLIATLSQIFIYPGLMGVDPWKHNLFTNNIIITGFIPTGQAYSTMPIFHLIIAITSQITNIDYKISTVLSISIMQIILNILFVYLITIYLFNKSRIYLIAPLLVSISVQNINMGFWSIPTSIAASIMLISIYLFMKLTDKIVRGSLNLSVITLITVVFTHTITTISSMIALCIICIISIYDYINNKTKIYYHTYLIIIFFICVALFNWVFMSNNRTFGMLVSYILNDTFNKSIRSISMNYDVPLYEQVFNSLNMTVFFSLAFFGFLYMISKKGNKLTLSISLIGFTYFFISMVTPLIGYADIGHRWTYYSEIILCIPLAITISYIAIKEINKYKIPFISIILILVLTITSLFNPMANTDFSNINPNSIFRYSLTTSELQTFDTIMNKCNTNIYTDEYCVNCMTGNNNISNFNYNILHNKFNISNGTFLIRKYIINNQFLLSSKLYRLDYNLSVSLYDNKMYKIYDSGSVYGYSS